MRNDTRNATTKSEKYQNIWRKRKLQVLRSGHNQTEMKEIVRKEYLRRTRKLLETKLCSRNQITGSSS